MKKSISIALLLSVIYFTSLAQAQKLTASSAYEYLQNERQKSDLVLGDSDKPPIDSLKKAEKILDEALKYYHRDDVVELAKNDKYLFDRESDILFDLAMIKLKQSENDRAVAILKNLFVKNGVYYDWIKDKPYFEGVKNSTILLPVIDKIQANNRILNGTSLDTKFQYNISAAEKVAGLSKFWSEAKYNFAYFENVPNLDWDKLYLEYIPKVQDTKSTLEYYKVMLRFCAELKDGHTNIWSTSDSLNNFVSYRPPIRSKLVEGKVIITSVFSDSLEKSGIKAGMEIISIDKIPVIKYAEENVKPFQSASTTQDLLNRTYNSGLLRGNKNVPVDLELMDLDGKIFTRKLARTGYRNLKVNPTVEFKMLPNNVAYFLINEFETSDSRKKFVALFDSISKSSALILDIRLNGGGNTDFTILSYLTDKPIKPAQNFIQKYIPTSRAWGEPVEWELLSLSSQQPNGKKLYSKPVILLTGPQTFSAAEDFAVAFDAMNRGKIMGEATGGSTGQPLQFTLPGGLMGRVCTKRDLYPDGKVFVGVGVQPNITVKPNIADIKAGKDTVLEAALKYLSGK